jgi:hypothetical protein
MDKQTQLDLLKRVAALRQDAPASAAGRLLLKLQPTQCQQARQPLSNLFLKPLPGLQAPAALQPGLPADEVPTSSIFEAQEACKSIAAGSTCKPGSHSKVPTAPQRLQQVDMSKGSRLSLPPLTGLNLCNTKDMKMSRDSDDRPSASDRDRKPFPSKQTSLLTDLFESSSEPTAASRPPKISCAAPNPATAPAADPFPSSAARSQGCAAGTASTFAAAAKARANRKRRRQHDMEHEPDSTGEDADVEDEDGDDCEGKQAGQEDLSCLNQLLQTKSCRQDRNHKTTAAAAAAAAGMRAGHKRMMDANSGSDGADSSNAGSSGSDWQPSKHTLQAPPRKQFRRDQGKPSEPTETQQFKQQQQGAGKQSHITLPPLPGIKHCIKPLTAPMDANCRHRMELLLVSVQLQPA